MATKKKRNWDLIVRCFRSLVDSGMREVKAFNYVVYYFSLRTAEAITLKNLLVKQEFAVA